MYYFKYKTIKSDPPEKKLTGLICIKVPGGDTEV